MKKQRALIATMLGVLPAGCSGPTAHARPRSEHAEPRAHDRGASAASAGPARSLDIPAADPAGPDLQTHLLLDSAAVKLMSIRLRAGAILPEHASDLPVLIEAVAGAGAVAIGDRRLPIDASRVVSLAPAVRHAVTADAGSELVLLVHHLRGASAR